MLCVLVQVWTRVVDGELQDSTRPDLYEYIVDFLTFCPDLDLVWRYSDWALKRDPKVPTQQDPPGLLSAIINSTTKPLVLLIYCMETFPVLLPESTIIIICPNYSDFFCSKVGVQIFTKRSPGQDHSGQPKPDDIITYLEKHGHARLLYLEHLVLERHVQVTPLSIATH